MSPNIFRFLLILSLIAVSATGARALEDPLFHSTDPLAPRDEWGVLHQTPKLNHTDFFPRQSHRVYYYFKSGRELLADPAYVAALQVSCATGVIIAVRLME